MTWFVLYFFSELERVPAVALLAVFKRACSLRSMAASTSQLQGTGDAGSKSPLNLEMKIAWHSPQSGMSKAMFVEVVSFVLNCAEPTVLAFLQFDVDRAIRELARSFEGL